MAAKSTSNGIHDMWVLWHQTTRLMLKCEEVVFTTNGITPQQFVILFSMKCLDGPVTITDLARQLGRNTNSISTIVDRMEEEHLVKKVRSLPDRRSIRIVITKKGIERLKKASTPGWELINRLLSCYSHDEIQTLVHMIGKLKKMTLAELGREKVKFLRDRRDPLKVAQFWAKLIVENKPK